LLALIETNGEVQRLNVKHTLYTTKIAATDLHPFLFYA